MSDDKLIIAGILEAIEKIKRYCTTFSDSESFFNSSLHFDAVLMNFVVIGESIDRLPDAYRKAQAHIPWQKVKDFRNIIAHDYFGVDADEVWSIVHIHLHKFEEQLKALPR